ncbi:MAG TPA: STAS domain-containing protein [Acidobacteriaceae bacterium]
MPVHLDPAGDALTIRLEGDIDIGCAATLHRLLLETLNPDCPGANHATRISLAKINAIDITAVQLLWAAEREAQSTGQPLASADAWPAPVAELLRHSGFSRLPFSADAA